MVKLLSRRAFLAAFASTLLLSELSLHATAAKQKPGRKRALIIAVDKYHRPGDENSARDLHCTRDANRLKAVLKDKLAFDEIKVLTGPTDTKRDAIILAIKTFLADTMHGDVLMLHYSGHGSQVEDKNDPLGFDQTLVPHDYVSTKDGSKDIKDKELAKILKDGLNGKAPAAFLLTFDSCHSGTITRDNGAAKRGFERVIAAGIQRAQLTRKKGLYTSEALGSQGFTAISACRSDETDFETTDDDTKPIGSLTYALCRALSTANDKTTYRDLYECITSIMRSRGIRQTPQLEGPLDQTVLGNGVIQPSKYIAVQVEDGSAYLQAGTLMGIGAGSKVAIFAPGTNDFAQGAKLGEVTLTAPDITKALIEVPGKTAQELDGARALVTQIAYRESPLKVNLTRMKAHPQYAGIRARLNEMKSKSLVDIVDSDTGWDIQVCPARHICDTTVVKAPTRGMDQRWHIEVLPAAHSGPNTARKVTLRGADPSAKDTVVLLRGDSTFLGAPQSLRVQGSDERIGLTALGNSPDLPHKIEQALTRETRYRILSSLPAKNSDSRIHIEFRVITCEGTPDPNQPGFFHWKRDTGELSPARGTLPEVKVGTLFRIELCNTGTIPAHVVLVDLDPEGGISPLWPNSTVGQLGNDDNLIRPSKIMDHREWQPLMAGAGSQDYALWTFTEPIGSETFTAIATPEFADFGPLFDLPAVDRESTPGQRGPGPRELNSPLGKLFASITTRAAPASSGVPNTWQATAVHIQVKPN